MNRVRSCCVLGVALALNACGAGVRGKETGPIADAGRDAAFEQVGQSRDAGSQHALDAASSLVMLRPGTPVDLNGDGLADGLLVDANGDGLVDGIDTNGDGIPDLNLNGTPISVTNNGAGAGHDAAVDIADSAVPREDGGPLTDGGKAPLDASDAPMDASSPGLDANSGPKDAGLIPLDASGGKHDGGSGPHDAASATADAGHASDAGASCPAPYACTYDALAATVLGSQNAYLCKQNNAYLSCSSQNDCRVKGLPGAVCSTYCLQLCKP